MLIVTPATRLKGGGWFLMSDTKGSGMRWSSDAMK
jgi:hypothetical protein